MLKELELTPWWQTFGSRQDSVYHGFAQSNVRTSGQGVSLTTFSGNKSYYHLNIKLNDIYYFHYIVIINLKRILSIEVHFSLNLLFITLVQSSRTHHVTELLKNRLSRVVYIKSIQSRVFRRPPLLQSQRRRAASRDGASERRRGTPRSPRRRARSALGSPRRSRMRRRTKPTSRTSSVSITTASDPISTTSTGLW